MNIIAFVLSLLMIFAITTSTLSKKHQSDGFLSKSFSGYMSSSREAINEYEKYCFDNLKQISPSSPKIKQKEEQKENNNKEKTQNNTDRKLDIENAKINIYPLVMEKKEKQKQIYNLTASLIKTLYSNQKFYKKNFEIKILDKILVALENQQKNKHQLNFEALLLKTPSLKETYYKMIKGTKFYDFNKKIGTPSLLDYVKIENTQDKILMKDASKELLISLFNEKIADEINYLQIKSLKDLTYKNVLDICQKNNFTIDENYLKLFDFAKTRKKQKEKLFVGTDSQTDIKSKIKMPVG